MMAWKHCIPDYPHITGGEDTLMVEQLHKTNRIGLLDMPSLYCYVVHSNNTWKEEFFFKLVRDSSHQLSYGDLSQISKVLPFQKHICAQNILLKMEENKTELVALAAAAKGTKIVMAHIVEPKITWRTR
jgi:hypothetical protein